MVCIIGVEVGWHLFTVILRDRCKTPLFARFLRQAQNLILEILNVFLWLKLSPSLNSDKNMHFSKVSLILKIALRRINDYSINHAKMIKLNIIIINLNSYIF
jgi:hypothetical protein